MSTNVTEHKGLKNPYLIEWARKYELVPLDFNYKHASYNLKQVPDALTKEVLIKNY